MYIHFNYKIEQWNNPEQMGIGTKRLRVTRWKWRSPCCNFYHLLAQKPNLEKKIYLFKQIISYFSLVQGFGQVG